MHLERVKTARQTFGKGLSCSYGTIASCHSVWCSASPATPLMNTLAARSGTTDVSDTATLLIIAAFFSDARCVLPNTTRSALPVVTSNVRIVAVLIQLLTRAALDDKQQTHFHARDPTRESPSASTPSTEFRCRETSKLFPFPHTE